MNRCFTVLAVLAAVAVVAAPAHAQQAAAYTNALESASDASNWYIYAYPSPIGWAVDGSPVGGHGGSAASLNFNNGTDLNTDWCYGYVETTPINCANLDSPSLSFWCRADLPDIDQLNNNGWYYRELQMYDPNYNYFYYWSMGNQNYDIDCGTPGDWHQHTIPIDPSIAAAGSFMLFFYIDLGMYGLGSGAEGWFVDDIQILVPDITPPDTIGDLAAANPTLTEIELSWTSPNDDDISGTTASFDLRLSTSPINGTNFDNATPVSGEPAPGANGTAHNVLISGLTQDTIYYFAIKTTDIAGNVSLISNVATLATLAPPPPPPAPSAGTTVEEIEVKDDILPCSAGTTAAPMGLMALAGLIALGFALRRKA